jgi:hypothetical protein
MITSTDAILETRRCGIVWRCFPERLDEELGIARIGHDIPRDDDVASIRLATHGPAVCAKSLHHQLSQLRDVFCASTIKGGGRSAVLVDDPIILQLVDNTSLQYRGV